MISRQSELSLKIRFFYYSLLAVHACTGPDTCMYNMFIHYKTVLGHVVNILSHVMNFLGHVMCSVIGEYFRS